MQQQARVTVLGRSVEQDAALLQFGDRLAMAGQAFLQHLVIGRGRRGHQRHARRADPVKTRDKIVADESDMLNTLAIIGAQIFLDLAAAGFAFLVQRNADLAVRRGHRPAGQPGIFALDVEIADFAEVEDALVKARPMRHPPRIDIMRQMIDQLETGTDRVAIDIRFIDEVDVVDAEVVAPVFV